MPCIKSSSGHMETSWFRTEEGGEETQGSPIECRTRFQVETKHSGNYTSLTGMVLHLQVLDGVATRCVESDRTSVYLKVAVSGTIPCPRFLCGNNTDVIWYKGNKPVCEMQRDLSEKEGNLTLRSVKYADSGIYFCDRLISDQGVLWTLRRAVNVTAIPSIDAPTIPEGNTEEEVELGQPHTLTCTAYFDFEPVSSRKVEWYMNYGGNMENMTPLPMEASQEKPVDVDKYEVIKAAIIKEVTLQHLSHTYTCIASNTAGNSSITVKLKRKIKEKWPSLFGYPIVSVLLVSGLGVILHLKWLEIQLIYKSHFKFGKQCEDGKQFDVFLSHVWSAPLVEVAESSTLSSRPGLSSDDEQLFPITVLDKTSNVPLEGLLPHVLEGQWGYRLCLLERDVVPGGAYTNDVVLAVKRSRMLICVLSAEYLSNSNAVFVLESGVKALLQASAFKLLVIWTGGAPTSPIQQDLPKLVQRALKVLPSLDWNSGNPARGTGNFWRSLRKILPRHRG
ncbi:interleukin-18 receptor accessory protein-like isoform X2 [Salarias fasciatus]|nr:interleukin-18 receptor accessory protein-like isoform X2 [Salarias fasciatus]